MADTPPNPWPGFQHDPANTGQAPVAVATPGAELTVVFKAPQEITAGIAIGADGSLLFACADNNLYAVSPTGDLRWTAPLSYQTRTYNAVPAVTPEGLIYAGGLRVYCFDGGGTKQWQFPVSSNFTVTAPLTLGSDGTLYVVGTAAPGVAGVPTQLIALAPNGTQRWAATLDGTVYAAPALGPGGAVYVGTKSGTLYAFTSVGAQAWTYATGGSISSAAAVGTDGTVYVIYTAAPSALGTLVALHADGSQRWLYASGEMTGYTSTPAITSQGTVYAGFCNLAALNGADGTLSWKAQLGTHPYPQYVVVGANGMVVFFSQWGYYGIVAADGSGLQYTAVPGENSDSLLSSPAVAADGTVYFGGQYGSIYGLTAPPVDPPPVDPPPVDPPPVDPPPVETPPVDPPPSTPTVVTSEIIWATTDPNALQQASISIYTGASGLSTVLDTGTTAFGIARDEQGQLYWSDGDARICRLDSGTTATAVVTGLSFYAYGFAVAGGVAYVADPTGGKVWAVGLDGSAPRVLVSGLSGLALPCDTAVDAAVGRLYWAAYGNGTIGSAALDGSGAASCYTGLAHPQGVTVDPASGTLYWVADGGVYAGPVGGGTPRLVAPLGAPAPGMLARRLTFDSISGSLYVSDRDANTVWTVAPATGTLSVLYGGLTNPTVIAPPVATSMVM